MLHTQQELAPSRVTIEADEVSLSRIASESGIPLIQNPSNTLLQMLPAIDSMISRGAATSNPSGFSISQFSPGTGVWNPVDRVTDGGAYRFDTYRPEYRFVQGGKSHRVEKGVAIYGALARAGLSVGHYDTETACLHVPASMRPPLLYERAVTLASCTVPTYSRTDRSLSYTEVSESFASAFLAKLVFTEEENK
jgi:hypothetical protein